MATASEELKLLGARGSPFVMRARIALKLKGLKFEFSKEGFGNQKSELLLKSNPVYKLMPVLIHNGKPICESAIIVEYIDEVWAGSGPSILPSDSYDRAIARFWAAFVDDKIPSPVRILTGLLKGDKEQAIEQIFAALQVLEDAFKKCSKGKIFFGRETIGFVDIALGSWLEWLKAAEKMHDIKFLDVEKIPLLVGWAKLFSSNDAVVNFMPEADELIELSKLILVQRGSPPTR